MKPARERTLAARGMLPLVPLHNVCFVPLDFAHPLEEQGPFDVILHKVYTSNASVCRHTASQDTEGQSVSRHTMS